MTNNLMVELLDKVKNSQSNLESVVSEIEQILNELQSKDFENLSNEKKIEIDLLILYAINSLYFISLRINHSECDFIKGELKRVQQTMKKFKEVKDRLTIMPRLDTDASKRFVRNALWTPPEKKDVPKNKKIKFDGDGNVTQVD